MLIGLLQIGPEAELVVVFEILILVSYSCVSVSAPLEPHPHIPFNGHSFRFPFSW